ncbi:NAD(P)H-hydrate dehydratase [Rhodosalinus sp. K401]|uniref:NAD(P)H-hydrate dehydratase n=1 Tax=Rhodosalinus sp. K401 TaxID=3239195 RepID=UPI003524F610
MSRVESVSRAPCEVLTAEQMRAAERSAMEAGAATGLSLMERAGRGVVAEAFEAWPDLAAAPRRAWVLCGPGNNGGDGFVVARLLAGRGWQVEVVLFGEAQKLPPDTRANHDRWAATGPVHGAPPESAAAPDLVVDALFGTGLGRAIPDELVRWGRVVRRMDGVRVLAVDIPSGLCADSGAALVPAGRPDAPAGGCVFAPADLTVSFHRAKPGHFLRDGPRLCGRLAVHDIGLGGDAATGPGAALLRLVRPGSPPFAPPRKRPEAQKYEYGHALVLSGGVGQGGAARLAARGALRMGAGLVTVGCPPEARTENAARLDAIMLREVADADRLAELLEDPRITVLCLGPGLGTGTREAAILEVALRSGRAAVLDADALTLLAADRTLARLVHAGCVLTPHGGEFARLFPDLSEALDAPPVKGPAVSKVEAARQAAARLGCTLLFKGADTVIAGPGPSAALSAAVHERAAPWLATAGAGDVLSGFVAGLLAQGRAPLDAAATAAWLHQETAIAFGAGLVAEDLPEMLPSVLRSLG